MLMNFNYFYGRESDQFSFLRIPRCLITDTRYAGLSTNAKLLYGMLLDRMEVSVRNEWIDAENKVYVIYQISEIQNDLNVSKRKAMEYLRELETCGLVEKKPRGLGLPSLLYVQKFVQPIKA